MEWPHGARWHLGNYRYAYYRTFLKKRLEKITGLTLDAGCGEWFRYFPIAAETVVGLDVSRQQLIKAKREGHVRATDNLVAGSITYLPFAEGLFDCILSVDVLEHVAEKELALNEFHRSLKSGGVLLGSTTNLLNPVMFFDSRAARFAKYVARRFAGDNFERHDRFSFQTLRRVLKEIGFKVSIFMFGFPPFRPWYYEYSNKKLPWYAYIWIVIDYMTNVSFLTMFKEIMVFEGTKT